MAIFDLMGLLVEDIVGSMFGSVLFVILLMVLISIITKLSLKITSYLVILFFVSISIGMYGSIFVVPVFVFSFIYFWASVLPWFGGKQQ